MRKIIPVFIIVFSLSASAQVPVPVPAQQKRILLLGATVHTGNGVVYTNGAIGFSQGKLNLIADASLIRIDRTAYDTIINLQGKHVYPGLIAMNTTLGLNEIEAVRATNDFNETGSINPSARAIVAYNTDSRVTPTVRSNGVLLAQIVPRGGLVSGQSSVVQLDAWNYEDAAYSTDQGIHVNWPSMRLNKSAKEDEIEKQQQRMNKELEQLRKLFSDAKAYAAEKTHSEKNIHLEAMTGLFNGNKKLYVNCNFIKEIISAINFCDELGIKMVLVGGNDALIAAGLLRDRQIPVIIVETHRLPSREDEAVDQPYRLPAMLRDSGISVAITAESFWQMRNIEFHAGTAAGYGLSKEEALQTITATPAKILGIDSTVGTLETGKDATLVVCSGDILDMKSSTVEEAFINGRQIDLNNPQTYLNEKFRKKYGQK